MSKNRIQVTGSYVVAGDEIPEKNSLFHTFPSLSQMADGSFLCTCLVGTEKTGPDGRIKCFQSTDSCETWKETVSPTLHDERSNAAYGYLMCHITEIEPGHLLAVYLRANRFDPQEPLFHPETDGMQHTEVRLTHSHDGGSKWSEPLSLNYELPDLIVPGNCMVLPDGSLGIPCEVWHEWDKGFRQGPSSRLIRSYDKGQTWPEAAIMAKDEAKESIFGDPRLTILPDGKIVCLFWKHNFVTGVDSPVNRTESTDAMNWSLPRDTAITGQIASPSSLADDGRMLCVYQKRFGEDAGLRAVLSEDQGITWDMETDTLIWQSGQSSSSNPFSGYQEYTFGYSRLLPLSSNEVLVSFWNNNGKTTCIRILRIKVL